MDATIWWALSTGLVTGAAWVGIVLLRRQSRLAARQPRLLENVAQRLEHLDAVEKRLAEIEGRLEFAERMLAADRDPSRSQLPPAGGAA
jgi:hypothetical protein